MEDCILHRMAAVLDSIMWVRRVSIVGSLHIENRNVIRDEWTIIIDGGKE
jgi:hypothetical protein